MNTLVSFRKLLMICLVLILGLAVTGAGKVTLAGTAKDAQPYSVGDGSGSLAAIQIEPSRITWQPLLPYASLVLTVAAPDDSRLARSFPSPEVPTLEVSELNETTGSGGVYTYELRLVPLLDAETQAVLAAASADPVARLRVVEELRTAGKLPNAAIMAGTFAVWEGHFVLPVEEGEEPGGSPPSLSGRLAPNDVVHADDVIVTGSLCVGFDCLTDGTENFGFDTIKLKENNLQVFFDDTSSTAGFPANDWRIVTNDSSSGGANYFAIQDSTGSRTPFKIEAGAPNNALYVRNTGRIGMGTNAPAVKLHLVLGDTPAVRLDQDTSSGWTAQVWDLAGNESNFFVRDTTGGSKLPFRIQPGSPTNSLTLKSDGKIGIGTWSPAYPMELEKTGEDAVFVADRTDGATAILSAGVSTVRIGSVTNHNLELVVQNTPVMTLNGQGNMTLQGALSEYSDVNAKENLAAVDGLDVLSRLGELSIMTWNYRADDSQTQHMGPMAQDFYASFGLGSDNQHIAPLDVNGVSLAAIQALNRITADQKDRIAHLEVEHAVLQQQATLLAADNAALKQRVDRLESRLAALEQAAGAPNAEPGRDALTWILAALLAVAIVLGIARLLSAYHQRQV